MIPSEIVDELKKTSKDIDEIKTPSNKILVRLLIIGIIVAIYYIGHLLTQNGKKNNVTDQQRMQDLSDCNNAKKEIQFSYDSLLADNNVREQLESKKKEEENEKLRHVIAMQDSTKYELLKKIKQQ